MQRAFARLWLPAQVGYLCLDVRAADWALGMGLYKGEGSLGPVMVGAFAVIVWLRLNLVGPVASSTPTTTTTTTTATTTN